MTFEKTLEAVKEAYPNLDYETLKNITKMVYRFGYEFGDYRGWKECWYDDGNVDHTKTDSDGNDIAYNDGNVCLKNSTEDYDKWFVGYCNDISYTITNFDWFYVKKRSAFKFNFKQGTEVLTNYEYQYDSNHNITDVAITTKDGIKRYTLQPNKTTYIAGDGSVIQEAVLYYYDFEYKRFVTFCVGFIPTNYALPLTKPWKRKTPDWYHLWDISKEIGDNLEDFLADDEAYSECLRQEWDDRDRGLL